MATSFGALCTDFYINQQLTMKMSLPKERETVIHMYDRVRASCPDMIKFRPYDGELTLESKRNEGQYRWLAMQKNTLRSGHVNPDSMDQGYELHQLILEIAPYHLTISPLDVAQVELLFGFDLECNGNHHAVVYDALYANSSLSQLMENAEGVPCIIEPQFGLMIEAEGVPLQATFDVKCRTTKSQIMAEKYSAEPISVFFSIKRRGPVTQPKDLLEILDLLRRKGEQMVTDHLIPELLNPIKSAIPSSA